MKEKNYLKRRGTFQGNTRETDTNVTLETQGGITLIALVITIVVLLIIAGVTLSIVFNGGIIDKSQSAVDKYLIAQENETEILNYIDNYFSDIEKDKIILSADKFSFTPIDQNWNVKNVKEALDYLYDN